MPRAAERVELDVGGGNRVVIEPDALEVRHGVVTNRIALASVRNVRLEERRIWALLPVAAALAFLVGYVDPWPARLVLLAALAASTWAFARMRRFTVHIERADGSPERVSVRRARAGAGQLHEGRRAMGELADELERRGVNVVR